MGDASIHSVRLPPVGLSDSYPNAVTNPNDLRHLFGNMDIYLFDQLLKGRLTPDMTILDAGCGDGRNLVYLMRCGCRAFGTDETADAVEEIRLLATRIAPDLPVENFQVGKVDALPLDGRRYRLPDGTDRFLVNEEMLLSLTSQLGGELVDPIKTTNLLGPPFLTSCL